MENLPKDKWYLTRDGKNIMLIAILLLVPLVTSVYSTIHVIDFLGLGNSRAFAIPLAATFEAGLLSALAALQIMRNVEKWSLYSIFIILTLLQLIGNLYYGYNYMTESMETNPYFIRNFIELFEFVHDPEDIKGWKRIIAFTVGCFLPIISLILLHMNMAYIQSPSIDEEVKLQPEPEKIVKEEDVVEEPVEETKTEPVVEKFEEAVIDAVAADMVYATLHETNLSDIEIEAVKKHQEDNEVQINEIKAELGKNVEDNLYVRLLDALYKNGEVKANDLIPKWEELLDDIKKSEVSVTDKEIKQFLVLCTVLKIIDMNDQNYRVFKKSLEQAKQIINLIA